MSWLQTHEVVVPFHEVRAGKHVFAIELRERPLRQEELARNWSSITSTSSQQFLLEIDDENDSMAGNTSDARITAMRSYSQFRKLWQDLIRATKTTSTASLARSNTRTGDRHALQRRRSAHSLSPSCQSRTEKDFSASCRCRNWNCAFRGFHCFLKSYPFPSKLLMKRSTPAVMESRRQGLELFVTTVRGLFDTFPRAFLQSIDHSENCHVLTALNAFFGFSEKRRTNTGPRSTLQLPSSEKLAGQIMKTKCRFSSTGSSVLSETSTAFSCSSRSATSGNETWNTDKDYDSPLPTEQRVFHESGIEFYLRQDEASSSDHRDDDSDFELHELETLPGMAGKLNVNGGKRTTCPHQSSFKTAAKLQPTGRRSRYHRGQSIRQHTAFLARNPSISASRVSNVKTPQTLLPGLPKLRVPNSDVSSICSFLEEFRDHLLLDSRALGSAGASLDSWNEGRQWELALYVASQIGHAYAVESILYRGTNPNAVMEDGLTSLHAACRGGHRSIVAMLLTHGADANVTDAKGVSPLLSAVQMGDLEVVEMLVEFGANVNLCNTDNVSAVHVAVACQALPVLKLLLESDAFVNTPNTFNGKTPLHLAAQCGSLLMCELLLHFGGNIYHKTVRGLDVVALAKSHGHQNVARFCLAFGSRRTAMSRASSESLKLPQTAAGASTCESSEVTIVSEDGYAYAVL
jgi:ankyrin repeat protein